MKDVAFISAPNPALPVTPEDNDVLFSDGDIVTVEGHARKFQDIAKILLTRLGSDPVFPTYGSEVASAAGARAVEANGRIEDSVVQAMTFLADIEESDQPSEQIVAIRSLKVSTPAGEPRQRTVKLDVALADQAVVTTNLGV